MTSKHKINRILKGQPFFRHPNQQQAYLIDKTEHGLAVLTCRNYNPTQGATTWHHQGYLLYKPKSTDKTLFVTLEAIGEETRLWIGVKELEIISS